MKIHALIAEIWQSSCHNSNAAACLWNVAGGRGHPQRPAGKVRISIRGRGADLMRPK